MKNSIKIILVIIGTMIGAGFASGQEIYRFFNQYGEYGFVGLCLSNLLTGFIIYQVLKRANKRDIHTYKELIENTQSPKLIRILLNNIINIFLLMSFYIMVAGFVAYFEQEFAIPKIITAILVTSLCYFTFSKKMDGITKVNNIMVPILILIIVMLGIKTKIADVTSAVAIENTTFSLHWLLRSIEYSSYNSILLIPILISMKNYAKNKEKSISILTTILLFILSVTLFCILQKYNGMVNTEIPLVTIASQFGHFYQYAYGIVIVFAIYSTMISAGFGFLENKSNTKNYSKIAIVLCISALAVCHVSFSSLVNITYPVFGIIGLLQLIQIFRHTA